MKAQNGQVVYPIYGKMKILLRWEANHKCNPIITEWGRYNYIYAQNTSTYMENKRHNNFHQLNHKDRALFHAYKEEDSVSHFTRFCFKRCQNDIENSILAKSTRGSSSRIKVTAFYTHVVYQK